MKSSILLLALLLAASLTWAQRAGYTPPSVSQQEPMRPVPSREFEIAKSTVDTHAAAPIQQLQSADLAKLKQDANELASLAQSIPPDVDQTAKGILPKDLDKKLRRIEKLSKQLRSRISP
jgi:hypothetical protein